MKTDETGRTVEFGEFPELETKRLVLRRMTLADAEFYLRHFSDPDIVELTAFDAPENIDKARQELLEFCIKPFEENKGIRWGIVLKGETELAGTIGYHQWVKAGGYHARVGYDLAAAYRRRGIMTEALMAVLRYGFEAMRLNKVEACTDSRNVASTGLLEKLGFHQDGVLRENTYYHGRFIDEVVFSLLASEWRNVAHAAEELVEPASDGS
jgi:ribosomal-protein-alanine N-acetyltransferase